MDVRCERCSTEYELDEDRIAAAGVVVRCARCGNIFLVKKKTVAVTGPLPPEMGELPFVQASPLGLSPVAPGGASRQNPVEAGAGPSQPAGRMPQSSPSSSPSFENFSFRRSEGPQQTAGFERTGVSGSRPEAHEPAFTLSERRGESFEPSDEAIAAAAGVKDGANRPWSIALLVLVLGAVSYLAYRYFVWMPERQKQEQVESANREAAARAKQERERAEREQAEREQAQRERAQQERAARARAESRKAEELAKAAANPPAASGPKEKAEAPAPQAKPEPSSAARVNGESAGRGSFDSYMAQGDRLREREQPRNALYAYAKAAEMEPTRAEPFTGRGLALLDLGKTTTAIAAFRQALNLDPRYGLALMGLAEAYRLEGNKDEAIRYYERYLSVLPDGPEAPVAKAAIKSLQE